MKKSLIALLVAGTFGTLITACGTGSVGGTNIGPAAPAASQLPIPASDTDFPFTILDGGAAVASNKTQVAVPGVSGYTIVALPADVVSILAPLTESQVAQIVAEQTNTGIALILPPEAGATTTTLFIVTQTAQATQATKLQAESVSSTAESYTVHYPITTNILSISNFKMDPDNTISGIAYGSNSQLYVAQPNPSSQEYDTDLAACDENAGNPTTLSAALNGGNAYVAAGSTNGAVCVFSYNTGWVNLAAQAPANKYTAGNVNSFGFPSLLNNANSSLVGYWNVGSGTSTNIYRITGAYVNGTPTGNGFLNTTQAGQQTTTNGTTKVTFTGFPVNSTINSSYVDATGNVWVGTTNGKVFVLRVGATQWTNTQLPNATGSVTVSTDGSNSGTIATTFVSGATTTFNIE